ncbi:heat stress transcription factor A-3-like [Salvia miltiorrhiza]|uniref:heat stress transcription factor A-3-like n=1 Tax=Salvia miltiorrhiza TaxID=226208 RepID=UPI0025AD5659|nr:heat stress transcription factor A-3-like [Salvia miltiorrhiza]
MKSILHFWGFRKIDTDKWEFTNGGFVRGQRHLLKTIQRRKSHNPQQQLEGSSNALEGDIKELRRERRLMTEEVMGLQHEQRCTVQHMGVVEEKLEAAETRHKQMISFLATMLHSQTIPSSSRTMRRFVKHQPQLCNSDPPSLDAQDLILYTADKGDSVAMNPADQRPISSPQNVVVENGVPGFLTAEDAGLEAGHPWEGYVSDYDAPHLGVGGEFLDVSEIGSMQLQGSSGIKNWLDEESPVNYIYMDPSIK